MIVFSNPEIVNGLSQRKILPTVYSESMASVDVRTIATALGIFALVVLVVYMLDPTLGGILRRRSEGFADAVAWGGCLIRLESAMHTGPVHRSFLRVCRAGRWHRFPSR